jgi:ATP-binding cassette subfamily B protein
VSTSARRALPDEEEEARPNDLVLMRRVLRESKGYRGRLFGLFLLALAGAPLFLLTPVPVALAVDSVLGSQPVSGLLGPLLPDSLTDTQLLVIAAILQVLVVVLTDLQSLGSQVLGTATSERLTVSFRSRLFAHVQRLSFAFHDERGTADSLFRIQYDTVSLGGVLVGATIPIIAAGVTLIAVFVVIFQIDVGLALIAVAVSPVLVVLSARFKRTIRRQYREALSRDSSAMGVVQEVLATFRVVKAFGREDAEHARFMHQADRSVEARVRIAWTEGIFALLIDTVTAVGTGAVLFVGVRNVQSGAMSLGELYIVLNYLTRLYTPLRDIARKVGDIQASLAGAQRSFEILDQQPEITDGPGARMITRAAGAVEFRDVSFAYDGAIAVLQGANFAISPGTRVGIAGPTGAGKTTLISLLMRFYDPSAGAILLDGVDLREYRVADLRAQFALVLQEPVLFSSTVRENIAYGKPDATFEEVQYAADAAGAHGFIGNLPDGYSTLVGERGMRLSGGERQRISIARAFLKDAPLLVLDEPTSSVDVATEAVIMRAMDQLMEGRTTFMIAHRLGTLSVCDLVLEIDRGRVRPFTPDDGPRAAAGSSAR